MNCKKYKPFPKIDMPNRQWPNKQIEKAPRWCSVDLRDGNQALPNPMNIEDKIEMFKMLVGIGFKEIEIGFPAASKIEFDFTRKLIEENMIPEDVTIQVLVQAREAQIKRSFEALVGVKNAIVHLYNSTSKIQRDVVFRMDRDEIKEIAVQGVKWIKQYQQKYKIPNLVLEYSPESFSDTELDFAVDICNEVINEWQDEIIINLPATVEMATPNVYADQIEWMCANINNRKNVCISVHTHNDRGTAVAAAELGIMAGADRVEGAMFGNGERTGNLDIVTMAMNMFSQGIDPELDYSDINTMKETYERITEMPVHPRHPYAGEYVFTAFSGSHQDAINKGLTAQKKCGNKQWKVPYLPIDPADVGRQYESVIRINSQSGKGGIAYILEHHFGIKIPKEEQANVASRIQAYSEQTGEELQPDDIFNRYQQEFV